MGPHYISYLGMLLQSCYYYLVSTKYHAPVGAWGESKCLAHLHNVKYYDVILGVPFLKQLGICLDFRNPARILIGNKEVPTNKELALGVPKLDRKRNQPMNVVDGTVNE